MTGLTNAPEQVDDVDTHAATHYADGSDPIDLAKLGAIPALDKGKAGGVATLGEDGKVPSKQLPEATTITSRALMTVDENGTLKMENQLAEVDPDSGELDGYATEDFVVTTVNNAISAAIGGSY